MSPARALHGLAAAENADLIVLGSTHRGPMGRIAPGSVGQRLLNGAPCAVSVAPRGFASSRHRHVLRVGVAYDASEEAKNAQRAARRLAAEVGASVRLISVISDTMPAAWGGYGYGFAEYLSALRDAAREELDAAAEGGGEETVMYEGSPAAKLADATEHLDLLFLGSRGYGPVRGALLGSVSGELLRKSACPVIVLARGVDVADSPAEPLAAVAG
jgi:nucleotide-binding universal stress UspA family protein